MSHKQYVKESGDYLKVIIDCLMFKAQQNIEEQCNSLSNSGDVIRGNFLELIHLQCKDIAWLKDKIHIHLQKRA